MNVMNLKAFCECGNGDFCFVEATGLVAALAIEMEVGVEMPIGSPAIVVAWGIT